MGRNALATVGTAVMRHGRADVLPSPTTEFTDLADTAEVQQRTPATSFCKK